MQEQHDKYLQKVQELFFQYGIKSITMDHIARSLGVSKKTLYQWVKNKNELVKLFIGVYLEKDRQECIKHELLGLNAIDIVLRIKQTTMHDVQLMKSNILFDVQHYHPEAWELLKAHQRDFITEVVSKNLNRGIDEGLYRPELNIELISRLHGHQIFNLFDEQWFPRTKYTIGQVISEFMQHYLYGIASEKGRKYLAKALKAY